MTECEEEARPDLVQMEEKAFVSSLHSFMKDRGSPIERIPHLGFKQSEFISTALLNEYNTHVECGWNSFMCVFFPLPVNLWRIYKAVEKLGGYESVSTTFFLKIMIKVLWKLCRFLRVKWAVGQVTFFNTRGCLGCRALEVSPPMLCCPWCWHCGTSSESATHSERALEQSWGSKRWDDLPTTTITPVYFRV